MRYNIVIETDEPIDASIYKVYLDMKKKLYIKNEPIPTSLTKLDCECKTNIKYSVNK